MPMNTANKLTLARVFMIPLFLVIAYWGFPGSRYVALGIYIVACLTDLLDGYIARHYNHVSDFGKFMDPLADKILVMQHGRITEMGNHEELMAKKGYYYELVQLQTGEDLV